MDRRSEHGARHRVGRPSARRYTLLHQPEGDLDGSAPVLVRPRLLRRVSAGLTRRELVIVGPYGVGKETLLRTWQHYTGTPMVWLEGWSSEHERLEALLATGTGPVVAVVRIAGQEPSEIERELQDWEHPRLRIVRLVSLTSAGMHLGHTRLTGRDLLFTREEIAALAALTSTPLSAADVDDVLHETGGFPMGVSAVVGAVRERGGYDREVLERAADSVTEAVAGMAADGVIHDGAWRQTLMTSVPQAASLAQIARIWDTDRPEAVARLLEAGGLAEVTSEGGRPWVRLIPSLRAGLRRRLPVEMGAAELRSMIGRFVASLMDEGEVAEAVALAVAHGIEGEVGDVVRERWVEIARAPAEEVAEALRPAANSRPELTTAYVRSLVDVTHTGHPGELRGAEVRRVCALLSGGPQPFESGDLAAMWETLGAVLARRGGRHEEAERRHGRAFELLPEASHVAAAVHVQAALTALDAGSLSRAAELLLTAQHEVAPDDDPDLAELVTHLDILVAGYLGARHSSLPAPEPVQRGALTARAHALAEAARLIARLEVDEAWTMLGRLPAATGDEEPLALLALQAQAEAMAHLLSGTAVAGLGSIDVMDSVLDRTRLAPFALTLLRNTRAELLVATGEPEAALAVLDEGRAPQGLVSTLVRALVLLALDRPREAHDLLEPLLPSSSTWASNYPTWMLVMSALVLAELGEDERADMMLGRGVAIASRSGALLPFARQGSARLGQLLSRARDLRLDPASRALLDRLDDVHERMRVSSLDARLSERELVVLSALRETGETRKLAAALHVSPNTVKSQLQSIYRKLGASTRIDALRTATMLGLLDPDPQRTDTLQV